MLLTGEDPDGIVVIHDVIHDRAVCGISYKCMRQEVKVRMMVGVGD